MFRKVFVLLLVQFIAFYPVLTPLANATADVGQGFSRADSIDETTKVQVQQTFGKLPLYFIQNNGQIDEKGSGHTTYFTKEGIYLALVKNQESSVKNEIASGLKPFAMTPLDSRLQTNNL